ncbi:tumor necrosis factor receptor superfamily member 6B [Sphaerodactylus townsendi]|nr:tumor necrosis factor receptor superfamily member 6B [Sphaerodactylus townsendi]
MMQTDCKNRSFRNLPTWMVYGLLAFWSPPVSSSPTYKWQDPITNYELVCQQCPPGTFVAQHCTQDMPTRCESCPSLYYTQYWNYLDECLYCNTICNSREEEVRPCNATHDRACHCKAGYYFDPVSDFCLPHSTCPLGSGVAQPGTPHEDAKCAESASWDLSPIAARLCQLHTDCVSALGLELNVPGNQFHDALCTACKLNQTNGTLERPAEGPGRKMQLVCPATEGFPKGNSDCEQAYINRMVFKITSLKKLRLLKRMLEQGSLPKEGQYNQMQLQAEIYSDLARIRNTPSEASVTKHLLAVFQKRPLHRSKFLLLKRSPCNRRHRI